MYLLWNKHNVIPLVTAVCLHFFEMSSSLYLSILCSCYSQFVHTVVFNSKIYSYQTSSNVRSRRMSSKVVTLFEAGENVKIKTF